MPLVDNLVIFPITHTFFRGCREVTEKVPMKFMLPHTLFAVLHQHCPNAWRDVCLGQYGGDEPSVES